MLAHGCQLEQGIEVHKLNARTVVDLLLGNHLEELFHDSLGVWITVRVRIAKYVPILTHAHKVHAPSIDADALYLYTLFCHLTQCANNLCIQCIDIPIEMSTQLGDAVRETSQLSLNQLPVLHTSQDGTATGSSQIHCQEACIGCLFCVSSHIFVIKRFVLFDIQSYNFKTNLHI